MIFPLKKKVDNFFKLNFKKLSKVDVLINCAGIYGPKGLFQNQNWQNWKDVIRINLLGSIYIIKKFFHISQKKIKAKLFNLLVEGQHHHSPFLQPTPHLKLAL